VVDVGEPLPILDVVPAPDVGALLSGHDLRVTTMGRGPDQEPSFFAACGAAGVVAARLAGAEGS
jgi:hypothetical protein